MNLLRYFEWPLIIFRDIWLRKEKKNDYPLDKDFVYIFEVIYAKKDQSRDKITKRNQLLSSVFDQNKKEPMIFILKF